MSFKYSVKSILRDSFAGEMIYWLSGERLCLPEYAQESYTIPQQYLAPSLSSRSIQASIPSENDKKDEQSIGETNQPPATDTILVDWDGPEDVNNPKNWPVYKKAIVSCIMAVCTSSLYMGSALFTPAEGQLIEHFHTTPTKVTSGLSLFVWGYGIASLWFSPMSELPAFGGRNYIYLFNQVIFVALQIPTALSNHIAPFAVLRLLAGIMAAPPLSTGAATYSDIFDFPDVVYALIIWSVGAIMGPCIGPLIGAALVQHNTWRWAFWYLMIQAGAVLFFMVFLFPETSAQAILMKKARILRKKTGNMNILAPGDILRNQKTSEVVKHIFWNPIRLTMREPVILLTDIHIGLMYALMYSYFEAVPIAYGEARGWNLVKQGVTYVSVMAGCYIMAFFYIPYSRVKSIKPLLRGDIPNMYTVFGNAAIVAAIMSPISISIFGWTSDARIHWFPSMIGNALFGAAIWLMFQSYFSSLANLYPPSQLASVYASNSVARSMLAAAFPLFARTMYNSTAINHFPVGWGCTILGFISIPSIGLPIYVRNKGEYLHKKAFAKYAEGDGDHA